MMSSSRQYDLIHTQEHICVRFQTERQVLSCAVLNGGYLAASNIMIMKVPKNGQETRNNLDDPEKALAAYIAKIGLAGTTVGMMTAAPMRSLAKITYSKKGVEVTAVVTTGISNARCAGDRAEWRQFASGRIFAGTINSILITNASLTPSAMVESAVVTTEAKTVALRALGIKSPVSGQIATGTGTDAIAIVNGAGPTTIRYCGKHVLFGEMIAAAIIDATTESLRKKNLP